MHSKVCQSSVVYMNHSGRICGGSSPEMTSPEVTGNDITGNVVTESREPEPGFCRVCPGTSLDSMYGQWNCESNLYRVTIALLPHIAMLDHFLNP